jgi:pimeloyl-ACP methyl ester carboxylesterase
LGGCAAMMYSSIFPEKVEKLILLDILRVTPTITKTVDYRYTIGILCRLSA